MSSNLITLQTPCPNGTPTSRTACEQIPNAVWVPGLSAGSGQCICCATNGTSYANPNPSPNDTINACLSCGNNPACGDGNGFCSPNNGTCMQDPTTKKFSPCPSNSGCTGMCTGSCGIGEWLAFSSCTKQSNNTYKCQFNITQWKSWLFWGFVILFLILIIVAIIYAQRQKRIMVPSVNISTTEYLSQPSAPPVSPPPPVAAPGLACPPQGCSFPKFAPAPYVPSRVPQL